MWCVCVCVCVCISYYTSWSAVAGLQGRIPEGAEGVQAWVRPCNHNSKTGVIIDLLIVARWLLSL